MFTRNPYNKLMIQQAGPVVINALSGDPVYSSDQIAMQQLHALALSLYQAQQDVLRAQQRGDVSYVQSRLQDIARFRDIFRTKAQQFQIADAESL